MSQITKAVILAAGRGTRMRELTEELPKPMIPVRGRPILEHIVTGLAANGVSRFLIIVGYRKDVVIDYFGDGSRFGVAVDYVEQVKQDGTGRVVELGREFTGADPFVLSYGDILVTPQSYAPLVDFTGVDAKIAVKRDEDVRKGGAVFLDAENWVTDIIEKGGPDAPTSPYYNAGIYSFSPEIYDFTARIELSPRGEYELTDAICDLVRSGRRMRAVELGDDWADVRDPEVLAELNQEA
ncbi:MAG: NTP transferase domain-containing protein [Verrucomicrobiae bacterium]|nr:NTP transferase domain-containing protein [Verrucomicrobiae bacterium]MCB1090468.1 NTP transferase domain-containing protein [Verrucomicrobiae bacterium]